MWDETDEMIRAEYERTRALFAEQRAHGFAGYEERTPAERIAKRDERARWGECEMMRGPQWEERHDGTLAVAVDGSSYTASVLTRENFGCVMHEPANEPHEG
jgi:hypothetical protein